MTLKQVISLSLLLTFKGTHAFDFLEESPVKLLHIHSVASRYQAADSEFRMAVENGKDEEVDLTEGEVLNGFPEMKLTLNPGGCAYYQIPLKTEEVNAFVQPAKKKDQDDIYWNYCDKAPISVVVSGSGESTFDCFLSDQAEDPCSSAACHADISLAILPDIDQVQVVNVTLCADPDQLNTAAIWEVNFSRSNESNKIEGFFDEEAKERFNELAINLDFNTQLSFVSIVGGRGVGKSTIASLLSGNSSMFEIGSGSIGTTTTGADLSPVIPAKEWAGIMQNNLDLPITVPESNLPVFLIDSEGMGVRSDAFDFLTTSPPAIVSKVVMWIGAEVVQTNEILLKIQEYLNGLDNILSDNKNGDDGVFCELPEYGHFVIAINKMQGSTTDPDLAKELLEVEPDNVEGSEERNQIRRKLLQCFDGTSVHGFPFLVDVEEGETVDYSDLNERFRTGVAAITNTIIDRLPEPKVVQIVDQELKINATNVEFIFDTIIQEANKGEIDLNGFDSFWALVKQNTLEMLEDLEDQLMYFTGSCSIDNGIQCTTCVCSYINNLTMVGIGDIKTALEFAKQQAQGLYGQDLSPYIDDFMIEIVAPWQVEHIC